MSDKELEMKFSMQTITHLGIQMYSTVPAALAELVANAYDADASKVEIQLNDKEKEKKEIIVKDDGHGMSFDEINTNFLVIGRNRRKEDPTETTTKGRLPSGKKGLGKLGLFGVGDKITITSATAKSDVATEFTLDWHDIKTKDSIYSPQYISKKEFAPGTTVKISSLKRKSDFNAEHIANSLAFLFVCFDNDFSVSVRRNDGETFQLTNESKFERLDIEFDWLFPRKSKEKESYENAGKITGKIITTETPLKPGLRGISLYARKRLIHKPSFFGRTDSSHFYTYATGILNVDFIDELNGERDLISTNRQSINWDQPDPEELQKYLRKVLIQLEKEWRDKRKEKKEEHTDKDLQKKGIDVNKWLPLVPPDIASVIQDLIGRGKNNKNPTETESTITLLKVIEILYENIVPPYAQLHWRYLHKDFKSNDVEDSYKQAKYAQALQEAIKIYVEIVQDIVNDHNKLEFDLMGAYFGENKMIKLTTQKISTQKHIEEGHKFLSMGLIEGFRHPLAHKTAQSLKEKGLISEQDCLDILSLLSQLLRRLGNRKSP